MKHNKKEIIDEFKTKIEDFEARITKLSNTVKEQDVVLIGYRDRIKELEEDNEKLRDSKDEEIEIEENKEDV